MAGHVKRKMKNPKTLRVFFSSPFGGMEEEREELTRKYFPQFQHACNVRGVQFVPVDMRWGITTEAADNAQVVNICLREIDRSDIFIGFFGQRYGWHGLTDELLQQNIDNAVGRYPFLDKVRDKSVTEFEFMHGHLNHPGQLPVVICFRDKAYDDSVREKALANGDKKTVFKYSAESDYSVQAMDDLIKHVKATENECLGVLYDYSNPHEGAKFMFESVWECFQEFLLDNSDAILSPLQQSRLCHDAFISSLTTLYIGGQDYLAQLKSFVLQDKSNVLITGKSGSGKSALLANFITLLRSEANSVHIIYHFIGCAQGTTDPQNIIQHILDELRGICDDEQPADKEKYDALSNMEEENDFHEIYVALENEMAKASKIGKAVVIIIDGLNKVTAATKTAKHLYWLPKDVPSGVSLIVSTRSTDSDSLDLLVTKEGFNNIEIHDLSEETQKEICEKSLMITGKELSPQQLQRVVEAEQTCSPLFLKIVLSEISIYGYFRLLDTKIDSLIYCNGVKDLLSKVLQRLEEDYNNQDGHSHLVQQVLSALAVSHQGLTETDIVTMFKINSSAWSPFYFALENFLINDSGLLRFAFSELQEAVESTYLKTEEKRASVKHHLIQYFKMILEEIEIRADFSNLALRRVANELPWLQKSVGDLPGLIQTLSDVGVFHVLEQKSEYELIDLWASTGLDQDEICQQLLASFDLAICDMYNYQQKDTPVKDNQTDPPGYVLLPVLKSMSNMFSTACQHRAHIRTLERIVEFLERVEGKLEEDVRRTLLRDNKYFLACAYVDDTNYDKAQALHKSVMLDCRKLLEEEYDPRLKQTLAFTCNGLGVLYLKQKKYKEAEPLFVESIEHHNDLGNNKSVGDAKVNIGIIKLDTGQPDVALEFFTDALQTFEEIFFGHLPILVGNLLTNIALCHRRMGDAEKAEAMYLRSMKIKAHAVGWTHEAIAFCYMNLGALEFYSRKNYAKAEEYNRKAIEIWEFNKVKLEQNEMWQTLENLVLYLICQSKFAEALPIFRRVFAMLQRENRVDQGAASVHREMMRYLISEGQLDEAANIAVCHLASHKMRQKSVYILLDVCDQRYPAEERPKRKREETVQFALEEVWPGDNELSAYVVQNYILPGNDVESLLKIVKTMDELNPDFLWTTYDVCATWCVNAENQQAAELVLVAGLEKYPYSPELKTRLFDTYRLTHQFDKAYELLREVVSLNPQNQAICLVGGQVAMKNGDLELCKELWQKTAEMEDESLAHQAKDMLKSLDEIVSNYEADEGVEDSSVGESAATGDAKQASAEVAKDDI
ncbi:tetratricopeptide repeat protein [Plakobranchus ocellatus]|uniref:Nephrocystin-3 n=1 Tax=Plakobranchus ocellatus TaxID=259542 RepID=A0AAV3YLI6_9GAST|nr:tetratricopeptide repeat protein [Plakobranchus ocellatus]